MVDKITARFIIEIGGKPVENVQKALDVVLDKLKKEKDKFKVIESEIADPQLDEKTTLYMGFIDVEIKFSDVKEILGFIMDYTPTSIEIEEPENINLDTLEFGGILNDMSAHILKTQDTIRRLNATVHFLNKKIEDNK